MMKKYQGLMIIVIMISILLLTVLVSYSSQESSIIRKKRGQVTEVTIKLPVFMILLGYPISFMEFIILVIMLPLICILLVIVTIEYKLWRMRRILPVFRSERVQSREVTRQEFQYPPSLMALKYHKSEE